jgi:hypothetical protein
LENNCKLLLEGQILWNITTSQWRWWLRSSHIQEDVQKKMTVTFTFQLYVEDGWWQYCDMTSESWNRRARLDVHC